MKLIQLSTGEFVKVDNCDFLFLNRWRWFGFKKGKSTKTYAVRMEKRNGHWHSVRMHRVIAVKKGLVIDGVMIDHRNQDSLDNRRRNLRIATASENQWNSKVRKDSRTGQRGIRQTRNGTYEVRVQRENKRFHVGTFNNLTEAIDAHNQFKARVLTTC